MERFWVSSFMSEKKDNNTKELIRFLITGVVCAIADYLTSVLFLKICGGLPEAAKSAISLLAGFIVGVTLNYILSTFWVFKGKQDNKVTKSATFIILFVLFSIIAYGLSYGTYELFRFIFIKKEIQHRNLKCLWNSFPVYSFCNIMI